MGWKIRVFLFALALRAMAPASAVEWGPDRVALSGSIASLDDGEGEQFRLALPAVRLLSGPFELRFDAVLAKPLGSWLVDGGAGMQRSLGTRFPSDGTRFDFTLCVGAY